MTTPEILHDFEPGQIYKDSRTDDLLCLVYIDPNVYLLRDEDTYHRIGRRDDFEREVAGDRFKLQPDAEEFGHTGLLSRVLARAEEYEQESGYKAAHKAEALREAISMLRDEFDAEKHEELDFESLDGIGEKAAANLRKAGYRTKADVRHASDEDLESISWVGEKGVASIRAEVK